MRCAWCDRRRKLRGSKVCDECAADWWFAENTLGPYDDEPEYEIEWLWEPSSHRRDTIALIAERKWTPIPENYVPSQLWDRGTPSC